MSKYKRSRPKIVILGRKRKSGNRHACGKLEQERSLDPKVIAFRMPHRAEVPESVRHDQRAEAQLGRYLLSGKIGECEYEAGVWYRRIVTRYRRLIEAPNANPPSLAVAQSGNEPNNEPLPAREVDIRDAAAIYRDIKAAYDGAFEALDKRGHWAAKSVARVAVYDEACPAGYFGHLRLGLLELALHRGLCSSQSVLDESAQITAQYFRNRR